MKNTPSLFLPFIALALCFTIVRPLRAQIQPATIFQSGLVIQRDVPVPVWGKSTIGDTVHLSFNGFMGSAVADANGDWEIAIAAQSEGGPYQLTLTATNRPTVTLTNIYVGDVWLAAGQSNMEWPLSSDANGSAEIGAANDQGIREFKIPKGLSKEKDNTLPGGSWKAATSPNVGGFSAVAYYFSKELRKVATTPIGIINASYGGARIEAFMSEETLGFDEDFTVLQPESYYAERQPTMIYNKMIHPLLRFPIKGILWYQGESNADGMEDAKSYGLLFKDLINSWRADFGLGDTPFLWVQLPNQGVAGNEASPQVWDAWPQVRAGQTRALSLPNTGEAVTIDVGDVDIHPTNKKPVGERLALVARKVAYGEDIVYSSPRYKSHRMLTGGKVEITFDFVADGLRGLAGDTVKWFAIAGSNNVFTKASAVITGTNTVEVWNSNITSPQAIRYAWEYNPAGVNLYNSADLPAAPFYIFVEPKPYALDVFTSSKSVIERGNVVFLEWVTSGASEVRLNGVLVDSSASIRLYPKDTTVYTLKTVNRLNPLEMDSTQLTVYVIDPQPTVSISSSEGSALAPGTATTIVATTEAPGGGTVTKVEFFVNGILHQTITEAPFQISWKSDTVGEFVMSAVVTDAKGYTAQSNPYSIAVTNLRILLYEAEDAAYSGAAAVTNFATASGSKLVEVKDKWTIAFSDVTAPEAGSYQLTIGYQLTFEGPKTQKMFVNGIERPVVFEGTSKTTIYQTKVEVSLKAGVNEIRFVQDWAWMSFDFISIAVDADAIIPPSISVKTDVGEASAPKMEVALIADVKSSGGAVTLVEFFVDGVLLAEDATAPYEVNFTPDTIKEYAITARVTDENNSIATSEVFILNVTNLRFITFEAEDATLTGEASVKTNAAASAGEYVEVQSSWVVKFENINVPTAGTYQITIGYQLTFEGPKTQTMFVNNVSQSVVFEGPDNVTWMKKRLDIKLNAGDNEIRFQPDWAWMSFDYLAIAVPNEPIGLDDELTSSHNMKFISQFPNPCVEELTLAYETSQADLIQIELINTLGNSVFSTQTTSARGSNYVKLNLDRIENGTYLIKLTSSTGVISQSFIVSK